MVPRAALGLVTRDIGFLFWKTAHHVRHGFEDGKSPPVTRTGGLPYMVGAARIELATPAV
jgi:hypothetical protein